MVTPKIESPKVALHPRSPHDRRRAAGPKADLTDRVDRLTRELRVQLVRIAQLQADIDTLRKKVG